MKHIIKAFSAAIVLFVMLSFTNGQDKLIGKWENDNDGHTSFYSFDTDGYVTIGSERSSIGGRSSIVNGITVKTTYVANYSTSPVELDIITTDISTGKEVSRMKGIVEFISADKMRMLLGYDSRPTEFIEGDAYIFTRVH